jgi:high-affinity nickel-transport protein
LVWIYVVKSLEAAATLEFWGGIVGALALGTIGGSNLYSMHRYGKTGSAILCRKIGHAMGFAGPVSSAFLTGVIFGLGFDTASQTAALTVSAVATATQGLQIAVILAGFFALGMIPTDTLDSLFLREVFSKIKGTVGFKIISYGLSIVALSIAAAESYSVISGVDFLPVWAGAFLAVLILVTGFVYAYRKHGSNANSAKSGSDCESVA